MVATPEFVSAAGRSPVYTPGSLHTALIPVVVVTYVAAIEMGPASAPEAEEKSAARVPRSHPIAACVRRTRPIAPYPGISAANEIPVSVHPVITGAWLRRPL